MKSILNVLKTGLFLVVEAPFRPRWAYYRARGFLYRYGLNKSHGTRVGEYAARLQPLAEAIASITDRSRDDVAAAARSPLLEGMQVQHPWVVALPGEPEGTKIGGPIEIFYGPSPELMRTVHIVSRLLSPEVVIETGVAKGFTSASILDALERNGKGKLYSVELPSLYFGYADQVGERIPNALRPRWQLDLGPSAVVLPRLLEQLGGVDVFIYDSASSYDNQSTEYRIALEKMRPGGILISDLLMTDAFVEAAEAFDCRWTTTKQTKPYPIGLMRKPG